MKLLQQDDLKKNKDAAHPSYRDRELQNMSSSASRPPLFFCCFLVLLLRPTMSTQESSEKAAASDGSSSSSVMIPLDTKGVQSMVMVDEHRRRLRNFQICSVCTCCGGPRGLCLASPCCYAISCNIPNRPFGFCSFVPKKCNCFGCHI